MIGDEKMKDFIFGNWQVTACPECGGNLSQVKYKNVDVMRGFTAFEEWEKAPTNYGFASLFPPNRIDGGIFEFEGVRYQLPVNEPLRGNHVHGVALREEWRMTAHDEDSVTMEFQFDENSSMYAGFPFKCKLIAKYIFRDNVMEQHFAVENLSDKKMPCALGFHSAFAIPQKMCIHGIGKRVELAPPRYLATGNYVDWKCGFEPNVWCDPAKINEFGHLKASDIPLAEFDYGDRLVKYLPDEKFGYWMVWRHVEEFDYICAEPMNIKIGTFENAPDTLPVVMPGEKELFVSKVEVCYE